MGEEANNPNQKKLNLIDCEDCGQPRSRRALKCPHCGALTFVGRQSTEEIGKTKRHWAKIKKSWKIALAMWIGVFAVWSLLNIEQEPDFISEKNIQIETPSLPEVDCYKLGFVYGQQEELKVLGLSLQNNKIINIDEQCEGGDLIKSGINKGKASVLKIKAVYGIRWDEHIDNAKHKLRYIESIGNGEKIYKPNNWRDSSPYSFGGALLYNLALIFKDDRFFRAQFEGSFIDNYRHVVNSLESTIGTASVPKPIKEGNQSCDWWIGKLRINAVYSQSMSYWVIAELRE